MASRAAMTATNVTPLSRKHGPSPTIAITTPAREGPTRRAPLTRNEFRAMALGRSSRDLSIWTTNDWRIGMSKALIRPSMMLSRTMCQVCTIPAMVRAARTNAWSIARACVATSSLRRSVWSASTPANGAIRNVGIRLAKPTTPSNKYDPVSRNTSHCSAIPCIHVPISDIPWPKKNSL